jgi:two-component system sensor kinase FixL
LGIFDLRQQPAPALPPPRWFTREIRLTVYGLLFLVVLGWFGLTMVERQTKAQLRDVLLTMLNANAEALRFWIEEQKRDVQSWAAEPTVRRDILSLVARTAEKNLTQAQLLALGENTRLRQTLGPLSRRYDYVGYVVFDLKGRVVSALLDEPVLRSPPASKYPFLPEVWRGETVLSLPFPSEVPLPTKSGGRHEGQPTMFAAAPVRDAFGKVTAVLGFRLRPEDQFSKIMTISRSGDTGETYVFGKNGFLLSESRFVSQLWNLGLLDKKHLSAILNIELRVPPTKSGPKSLRQATNREQWPPTFSLEGVQRGEPGGVNVQGYFDYRGAYVVGAWKWLEPYNLGIVTEIDAEEAFAPLYTLNRVMILILGLLAVILAMALTLKFRHTAGERVRYAAEQSLRNSEERMRAVVSNAQDAIITIDPSGAIETFNPAAERMFGYAAREAVGINISRLMPEPYASEHDEHIRRYMTTRRPTVLGVVRELLGLRKDGTVFPLELAASEMRLGDRLRFLGVVRDITQNKKAQEALKKESALVEMIQATAVAANEARTVAEAVQRCLQKSADTLKWPVSRACLFSEDSRARDGVDSACFWHLADAERYGAFKTFLQERSSLADRVHASRSPIWMSKGECADKFSHLAGREDANRIRSAFAFPVLIGEEVVAVVEFYTPAEEERNDEILQAMLNVGAQLARVIERRRAERELKQYASNLERSNQELLDFTFVASHDLQEPLRKVTAFADLLRQSLSARLDDKGRDYLDRMMSAIQRMQEFIRDFLAYSRINNEGTARERIDLRAVVEKVRAELEDDLRASAGEIHIVNLPAIEATPLEMHHLF